MLQVGITGGIGSGKSTVAKCFALRGVPVFQADVVAKELYQSDATLKEELITLFGKELYQGNRFQAGRLAELIFTSPDKLRQVNTLVHPRVAEAYREWLKKQVGAYVLKEAALLIASGSYSELDEIILVSCPDEIRIKRVMQRNALTDVQVRQRMQQQMREDEMRPYCRFEIRNDDTHLLLEQIQFIDTQLRVLSVSKR